MRRSKCRRNDEKVREGRSSCAQTWWEGPEVNDLRGPRRARELSEVDLAIVEVLRRDARTPNQEVARRAGIAPSTCSVRLRALERDGVIRGYHADVDPEALGAALQAMVAVRLRAGARHQLPDFTARMRHRPEVVSVFFVGGAEDFLVHVAVADAGALRDFVVDQLSSHAEVASTQTSVIFEHTRGAGSGAAP